MPFLCYLFHRWLYSADKNYRVCSRRGCTAKQRLSVWTDYTTGDVDTIWVDEPVALTRFL